MTSSQPLIRNCRFGYRCNQSWITLEQTSEDSVRYCNSCERNVHRCDTDEQLTDAILKNRCIAIVPQNCEQQDEAIALVVGKVDATYRYETMPQPNTTELHGPFKQVRD